MDKNNRRPSSDCPSRANEQVLGQWLLSTHKNYNNKVIYFMDNYVDYWEDFINDPKYIEYFKTNDENWNDILEECITIIIDKCISEPSYIDLYVIVLKKILDKNVLDIRYIINDKIKTIFTAIIEDDELSEYDKLCNINKRLDNSVGLCILIVKLEQKFIIENYIKNTIDRFLSTLDISNTELCDKSITSLYTIFTLLDPRFIIVYEDKLQEIWNQDIGKKNKFKIMDIFDLKK